MPKNNFIKFRVSLEEKSRLEQLSKMEGCSTLTNFCRQRLFQSLSTEIKLNNILSILKENKSKGVDKNERKTM